MMTRTIETRLVFEFLGLNYCQMRLQFTMRGFANSKVDFEANGAYDSTRLQIVFTIPNEGVKMLNRIIVLKKN